MKRFRFRLDRLLELKRYRERQWEIKLAQAAGRCALIREQIQNRSNDIRRIKSVRQPGIGPIDISRLQAGERYVRRMDHEIGVLDEELQSKETERRQVQETYLEASKERKVLDKLRERREGQYYDHQKKEDFKTADDMTLGRTARQGVKEG